MWKCLLCLLVLGSLLLFTSVQCQYKGASCTRPNEVSGLCVPLQECAPLMKEIQGDGKPIPPQLRRKLQSLACGFQQDLPLVCCNSLNNRDDDNRNDGNNNQMNNNFLNGSPTDVRSHPNINLLPTQCGPIESDRIFGGNKTRLFEMPWMVLIAYDSARGTKLSCGGTLISEWYVLTAAHCVSFLGPRLKLTGVILGEYDVRKDPDCERIEGELNCAPSSRNVTIDSVIPHPGYTPQGLVDDIALVRLSERADFTLDSMKPICLPVTPELQNEPLDGLIGVVAGWGATENGLQSPVLLSVDLPIVSREECDAAYNGSPRIQEKQMCAGGVQDRDSCGGDSGGPLMYPGRTSTGVRYVQRGVVSYGSKRCGIGGFPGVYTNVAYYMDWILDNMRNTCGYNSTCVWINDCPGIYNLFKTNPTAYLYELVRPLRCDLSNVKVYVCCPPLFNETSLIFQPRLGLLPNTSVCGIQSNDRIVGGSVTDLDEHPWLVLLRYDKPRGWGFYCAGVLISSKYVLTAAHCLKGNDLPSTWKLSQVRLGEWNISSPVDCVQEDCSPSVKDVEVVKLIPHENYDPSDDHQQHDIALLKLSRDVEFTDFIKPICLPTTEEQRKNTFIGYDMEVAGWGKTESKTMSDIKLKVRVPVVDRNSCGNVYKKAGRMITERQLCAGGEKGKDSCRGDSGGPLMGQTTTAQNWFVFGVVSYGPSPCGTSNWPGVYTRVGYYIDWILENIK